MPNYRSRPGLLLPLVAALLAPAVLMAQEAEPPSQSLWLPVGQEVRIAPIDTDRVSAYLAADGWSYGHLSYRDGCPRIDLRHVTPPDEETGRRAGPNITLGLTRISALQIPEEGDDGEVVWVTALPDEATRTRCLPNGGRR